MDNRRIEVARGKVVGGSSSINAMAYVRGNRADYERWASRGLPDWSYENVLPYFRKQESWEGGASHYRGGERPSGHPQGALSGSIGRSLSRSVRRICGYALNDDYNGIEQDGFARMQMTIRDGRRESAATGYLHPALSRENLTVRVNGLVTRIAIEGTRAVGVEYIHEGERRFVSAEREVILCGRRDQFAAAADAVRHRRQPNCPALNIAVKMAAARRRQEPAGPRCRTSIIWAPRQKPVPAPHAGRPTAAGVGAGLARR